MGKNFFFMEVALSSERLALGKGSIQFLNIGHCSLQFVIEMTDSQHGPYPKGDFCSIERLVDEVIGAFEICFNVSVLIGSYHNDGN